MSPPDGLLTSGFLKHDVEINTHIIAPDPFPSDDCLDVFSPVYQFLPHVPEELNTMNSSEDEPSSGLNGRLRPRKSSIPSLQSIKQIVRKLDGKCTQEKSKRSSTPSKASPSKSEELTSKPDFLLTPQLLCPYCDRKFVSKQSVSKHVRRLHLSSSKLDYSTICIFCNHGESEPNNIIRHMVDSHPNQYFACLDCHTRFPSTKELAEHKLNVCEKQKITYRSKLRQKSIKKRQKSLESDDKDYKNCKNFPGHGFNGIVISCELKPSHVHDEADIEDNITTNLILPPSKNLATGSVLEKNAVIVLDDIQWNRRIPANFSFHNTDADQILSRLGVVHRSPKTGESTKKDWFRAIEDATQKFEKCFDTSFYSKVASNVQENLSKFLDGSFNFNPDPDSTIKTRRSKNSVVINTAEGFPILLACEQYSRNAFDGYMPRTISPKHKWKWDSLENEKHWNPDQIKRDTHANNCIITLISSLDIWTQLCMRRKFEDKFNITPVEKKTEKQNMIGKELKEILESREIPSRKSQIIKYVKEPMPVTNEHDFPSSLGLMASVPQFNIKPAVLSGEWVRPRCYVCCSCGEQTRDSRALSLHVSSQHPNAQVQHYEIVGDSLLKADILKHLYVPPNQNINRTRPPRGFRDCTKCNTSVTIEDLHQHMLDCAGDTPAIRRKCRYRPFGVRRRRQRLPDNRIRNKMRNDIRTRPTRQKNRMRPRPKIRTEVGDAETIRKMLADLPAKRHRVLVNPLNSILRPRRKLDKQRAMLLMKRRTSEDLKSKSRTSNNAKSLEFSSSSEKNKNTTNREDDDNRPLKSRLKRVACKISRQKGSLKRKALLNKSKKKILTLFEKKDNEENKKELDVSTSCSEKVQTDELSVNHNEKRINLNSDPENIRENSSGGGDSSDDRRDNQRPSSSGQNGNSRNICPPAQNVPLKHSIASLTANSETHDKSVQFHHLFLVQQECNNINEHVPVGQRVLFENEAIVTKLDKPPLHFNHLESIQSHNIEDMQEHSVESIQGRIAESIQGHSIESIPGHSVQSIQGHSVESIKGQNIESIQGPSVESMQGQSFESTQKRNRQPIQGQNLQSNQSHNLQSIQGHNVLSIQGHNLQSIQGHNLQPIQGHDLQPLHGHNLQPHQGHHLQPIQGHNLQPIQGHNLQPIQGHELLSIQGHELQPIHGSNLKPIQVHNLQPVQGHNLQPVQCQNLQSIHMHNLQPLQGHNIQPVQGLNILTTQKRIFQPIHGPNLQPIQGHNLRPNQKRNLNPVQKRNSKPTKGSKSSQDHNLKSVQEPTLQSIQESNLQSLQGHNQHPIQGHNQHPIQGHNQHSIQGHSLQNIHGHSLQPLQGLNLQPVQRPNLQPLQGSNLQSLQGPNLQSLQGPNLQSLQISNLQSLQGPNLQSLQRPNLHSLQGPNLQPLQGLKLHLHQGPNLQSLQEQDLKPSQGQNLVSIQGHITEPIQGQISESIEKHNVESDQGKPLRSIEGHIPESTQGHDPGSIQGKTLESTEGRLVGSIRKRKPTDDVPLGSGQTSPKTSQRRKKPSARSKATPMPSTLYRRQHVNQDSNKNVTNEKKPVQWRPVDYDAMPRYIDNSNRREVCRRRSVPQIEDLMLTQHLLTTSSLNHDMFMNFSTHLYEAYNLPPHKSTKSRHRNIIVTPNNDLPKSKTIEIQINTELPRRSVEIIEKNADNHTQSTRKTLDMHEKGMRTVTDSCKKSVDTYPKNRIICHEESNPANNIDNNQMKPVEFQAQRDFTVESLEERNTANYLQVISEQRTSNLNTDSNMTEFNQMEALSNMDVNVMPMNMYTHHNFNDTRVSIPLAHASTNVEYIIPAPLDLSGKALTIDSNFTSRHDSMVLANYDENETLDLSNKSITTLEPTFISEDVVVDLRIKHNSQYFYTPTAKTPSSESPHNLSIITPLNLTHQGACIPTDLSLKQKDYNFHDMVYQINKAESPIQDLSNQISKTNISDDTLSLDLPDEIPTDLSNRRYYSTEQSTSAVITSEYQNDADEIHRNNDNFNKDYEPEDLSRKINDGKHVESVPKILSAETCVISETHQTERDNYNIEDKIKTPDLTKSYDIANSLSQIQRPVYNPTLRIPQYNIRPSESGSTLKENSTTEMLCSNATTTSVPARPQHQISMAVSYKPHDSALMTSSKVGTAETQEKTTRSFTYPALNVSTTTTAGSIPKYTYLNREIQTTFPTFEDTKHLCTLPNTSISLLAKSNVAKPTTISILSIPSTTISNVTPVYTLAKTTIVTPMNYGTLTSTGLSITSPPPCGIEAQATVPCTSPSSADKLQEGTTNDNDTSDSGVMFSVDSQLEITNDITMLPKEIMSILVTMTEDPRYKLLDKLQQSLSATTPLPILSTTTSQINNAGPTMVSIPITCSKEVVTDVSTDTVDIKPLCASQAMEEYLLQNNVLLNGSHNSPFESPVERVVLSSQVIDLTDDEMVPTNDNDNVNDEENSTTSAQENPNHTDTQPNVPKTNNDKTASLRAVRIKAPSERLKTKTMIDQSSNLPFAEVLSENDNNDIEMIDVENSSDIQLFEVSTSHQTNMNETSNSTSPQNIISLNELPQNSNGDDITNSGNIVIERNTDEMQSQESNLNVGEMSVLSVNTSNSHEINEPLNVPENAHSKNSNVQEACNFNESESSRNSTGISAEQLQETLVTLNISKAEEDDDSEDDISLAIIVKQKQENQNKLKLVHSEMNTAKDKSTNKIINIDIPPGRLVSKTVTEEAQKEIVLSDENKANYHIDVRSLDVPSSENDLKSSSSSPEVKSTHYKKRGKKSCRNIVTLKEVVEERKKEIQKNEHETDINNETDKLSEISKNLEIKENSATLKSNDQNYVSKTNTDLSSKKAKVQEGQEVSINKEALNLKDFSAVQEIPSCVHDHVSNNKVVNEENKDKYKKDESQDTNRTFLVCNLEEACNNKETSISSCKQIGSNPTKLIGNSVSVPSKSCDDSIQGNSNENDADNTTKNVNNCVLATNDTEDINLPLRRSRRGKSLFVGSNDQGTVINTESILEHKTPLTKKQLIFSKLLLDEENYIKSLVRIENKPPVSAVDNLSPLQPPPSIGQTTKIILQPEHTSLEESNKSIKRKKSPPLTKKLKKNKILDSPSNTADDSEKDDPQVIANVQPYIENPCDFKKNSIEPVVEELEKRDLGNVIDRTSTINTQSQNKCDIKNSYKQTTEVDQTQLTVLRMIDKRKIAPSVTILDAISSPKPKKPKLNSTEEVLTTSIQDETSLIKVNEKATSDDLPLAARRTRSKSVVVKSSGSMLYDPYDIELEDMAEITEPFRNQKLSLLRTSNSKSTKDINLTKCTENEAIITTVSEVASNIIITAPENSKETLSDSDESSKSDVPLKKYVEEKERKNLQSTENSSSKIRRDRSKVKRSKRKHKKDKQTRAENSEIKITDSQEESQERIRSEQFMESFGFFSERKPRKSNLLATKKISETFNVIGNESDDVYFESKDRASKKTSRSENRKIVEEKSNWKEFDYLDYKNLPLKPFQKDLMLETESRYCHICKKEFRRPDNLLRHQMTLLHVTNLCEFALKGRTTLVPDEPNYLVVFKQHMDRLNMLQCKMKSKKHGKSKFTFPTMQQILADVHRTVREQQLAQRSLSRDEALFIDCCELLKESNISPTEMRNIRRPFITCCPNSYALACASMATYANNPPSLLDMSDVPLYTPRASGLPKRPVIHTSAHPMGMQDFVPVSKRQPSSVDSYPQPSTSSSGLDYNSNGSVQAFSDIRISEESPDDKCDSRSDGDVDSITALNIFNSEEVRNLENDLISGLKEAAASKFKPLLCPNNIISENGHDILVNNSCIESNHIQPVVEKSDSETLKAKKRTEIKEKKNPDIIENIDIFEDKFDKIKRKCRSQAAAAKHVQTVVEPSISHKGRKKSEKKKGKKSSKKNYQNAVLTKGALKGFDSIKVSILTSEIDMSAIAAPIVSTSKKKKRSNSKKKKDKKNSMVTYKSDYNCTKESLQKNVDVYEFMDNEEPEIFGLRPSTVMERFRKINNKDLPNTSKVESIREELESSDSVSDGDDFVYMSDAYVCDDESNEGKKSPPPIKKKEVTEKNTVMDRIFKNNAVRSEKKNHDSEISVKPTTNLDQLFDSLLEGEPKSSVINEPETSKINYYVSQKRQVFSPIELSKYDLKPTRRSDYSSKKIRTPSPALSSDTTVSKKFCSFSSRESSPRRTSRSRYDTASPFDYGPSTSKRYEESKICDKYSKDVYSRAKKYDTKLTKKYSEPKNNLINDNLNVSPKSEELLYSNTYPKLKTINDRSPTRKKETITSHTGYEYKIDDYDQDALSDDGGVARQRARRKCTVGKQNVLAETWSSESEPDGIPPRPNSAESVVLAVPRKRKGRKKEGQICGGRKGSKQALVKKQDVESRVTSSNRNSGASNIGAGSSRVGSSGVSAYPHSSLSLPGPSSVVPRLRPTTSFWADGDEEQEHVQQHGWIVGDSHKKLVTMLAHAKGRKRKNDDNHMME